MKRGEGDSEGADKFLCRPPRRPPAPKLLGPAKDHNGCEVYLSTYLAGRAEGFMATVGV